MVREEGWRGKDKEFPGKHYSRWPGLLINSDTSVAQSAGRIFLEIAALPLEISLISARPPTPPLPTPFSFLLAPLAGDGGFTAEIESVPSFANHAQN